MFLVLVVTNKVFALQASVPTSAQTSEPRSGPTTLRTTARLVLVPTLVTTRSNELVFSLTAADFMLTDDGVPKKVTLEQDASRPLSLVVLMQTGGAARGQFPNYANLETPLSAILGSAPNAVSIVDFDSRVEAASPFTSDISQWRDAINHPDPGDSGAAIYDGLDFALDLLRRQPSSTRRAILLLSQEHDDGSKAKLKDIIRTLGETDTAVYSLTFSAEKTALNQSVHQGSGQYNPPLTVGDQSYVAYFNLGAALNLAIGAMRKNLSAEVASLSGGEASSFNDRKELDQSLGVLINHIRNSYLLTFSPTSKGLGLHTIKVGLAGHPDLLVTARANYWSSEAAEAEAPRPGAPRPEAQGKNPPGR